MWLGGQYSPLISIRKEDLQIQIQISQIVSDMLVELPFQDAKITPQSLTYGIRESINVVAEGNLSTFAKIIGKRKGAVSAWRSGTVTPSFQEIVRISFSTGISVIEILTGKVSKSKYQIRSSHSSEILLQISKHRNLYGSRILLLEKELKEALDQQVPESVASVSKKVGVPARYAWLYCQKLAMEVSERRKRFLSESYILRDSIFHENLSKTIRNLKENGIYPSLRKVVENVERKAQLRKDQKRFLWKDEIEKC
jgi:hypothetical protein